MRHRMGWMFLGLGMLLLAGCAGLPDNRGREASFALDAGVATPLRRWEQKAMQDSGGRQPSAFVLVDSADGALASRLALIEQATRTLDLQYYAIHADGSTRVLLQALRAAAARGVRVRILLDDFNTRGADAQVLQLAFVPHIEMRLFNPLPGGRALGGWRAMVTLRDFSRLQHRMHNKLFIADNIMGIVGGRNLGDAYFGQAEDSNFIDMDVLATGAIVRRMSDSFDRYWNHPLAYPVQRLLSRRELDRLRTTWQPVSTRPSFPPAPAEEEPAAQASGPAEDGHYPPAMDILHASWIWAPSALLADVPAKLEAEDADSGGRVSTDDTVVHGLMDLMGFARQRVLIVSPYFVPGKDMLARFAAMHQRGVQVDVLTNSLASTDAPAAHIGYARHRRELLRSGVALHEMRALQKQSARTVFGSAGKAARASLHAKLVVIDGRIVAVGSMNLDQRSHLQNSEVGLLIRSRTLAQMIEERVTPIVRESAWTVHLRTDGSLLWQAPPESGLNDQTEEPDASRPLRWMLRLMAPFAPDELL